MRKCFKVLLVLALLSTAYLFGGCGMIHNDTGVKADAQMEKIMSAIMDQDKEALRLLFSEKALKEANDFDERIDYLFALFEDNIDNYERDGWASDGSRENSNKTLMIRFSIVINPDKEEYRLFIIDYYTDTINPDNQGIYMIELIKSENRSSLEPWQDRMRAGIYIH